jgi:ribosomal protein L32
MRDETLQTSINRRKLMDFNEIQQKVSQSGSELTELQAAVKQLRARVDRHSMIIQVLKEMLLSRGAFSEDEFLERLEHAALQKAEGKTCRKCGKAISAKHKRCMYCGEERPPELL